MTKKEKIVVSAYTGVLMCDFADLQEYIEKKFGRPVFTHELADEDFQKEVKEKSKEDFLKICKREEDPEWLTDDDFETIRIHLNAYKEKLCNQRRWKEAEEYQRIIDRFMAFASAQPEPHWIPCSERMPKIEETGVSMMVLLCWSDGQVTVGAYAGDRTFVGQAWPKAKGANVRVIAWMPLPKPYGGKSE